MDDKNIYDIINGLKVSSGWKKVFRKIQVSYYHNFYQAKANNIHFWTYQQTIASLPPAERFKFFTRFNFFALIFGPIYYLAKLMIVKGLILLAIEAAIIYYFGLPIAYLAFLVHIYTSIFANTDYFIKKVVNSKVVKDNPGYLSDIVDNEFIDKVSKENSFYGPFVAFVVIVLGAYSFFAYDQISKDIKYQNIINRKEKICTGHAECAKFVETTRANISAKKQPLYVEYFKLGAAYYELGNRRDAIIALNQSTRLNQKYFLPHLLRGIIYSDMQQYNSARSSYEKALKVYPNGKFLYYLIGNAYYKEGRYSDAKDNFEKAVKAYPKKASYWEALAYCKIYLKDNKGAKSDLERVVKLLRNEDKQKYAHKIDALENYASRLK